MRFRPWRAKYPRLPLLGCKGATATVKSSEGDGTTNAYNAPSIPDEVYEVGIVALTDSHFLDSEILRVMLL